MKKFKKISKHLCEYEGEVCKKIRIQKKLSTTEFARVLQINEKSLELLEEGKAYLSLGSYARIEKATGFSEKDIRKACEQLVEKNTYYVEV